MANAVLKIHHCPPESLLAAYLDGELERKESARVEEHVRGCPSCAREVREQRRLLATLGAAFAGETKLALPEDFAKTVRARAQSDMSGVRARGERKIALGVCCVLVGLIFASLGVAGFKIAFSPLAISAKVILSISGMFLKAAINLGAGASVVLRFVEGRFGFIAPNASSLLWLLLVAFAAFWLRKMIGTYHRKSASE